MTYKFQISLLTSFRKPPYICIDNTLFLNQESIFMNNLKRISSLICLLLLSGQMLYAQISSPVNEFARADFINVVNFECSTSSQTAAGQFGAVTDVEAGGSCKQVDGCIVIIGG